MPAGLRGVEAPWHTAYCFIWQIACLNVQQASQKAQGRLLVACSLCMPAMADHSAGCFPYLPCHIVAMADD